MELAKPHIDVGLSTNALDAMLAFWQEEAGLGYDGLLKLGGGHHQHRHDMNGSVLKVNHARDPLPEEPPAGYRHLWIARDDVDAPRELEDPDGNHVTLVPRGHEGIEGIGVDLAVRSASAFHTFYAKGLGLPAAGENAYRCGDSLIRFQEDATAVEAGTMWAPGYRYTTIQVRNCDEAHAAILANGGTEGRAPLTLGDVARISFVRDPDGNWIEISQRASLTGPLPAK